MGTRFHVSVSEAATLHRAYQRCPQAATRTRLQALRLYGSGYSRKQVTEICACSGRSLQNWIHSYRQGGIDALADRRHGGNRACLNKEQIQNLKQRLHRYTPAQLLGKEHCAGSGEFWNVADLSTLLEREFALAYRSPTSYRNLLKTCDLSYQRPASFYKSRSAARVMAFEEGLEKKADGHRPASS